MFKIRQHISGCVKKFAKPDVVQLKEVINLLLSIKLMKLDKMFTVKRRIIIYNIQIRIIRSE